MDDATCETDVDPPWWKKMTWENWFNVLKTLLALIVFYLVWDLIADTRALIDALPPVEVGANPPPRIEIERIDRRSLDLQ